MDNVIIPTPRLHEIKVQFPYMEKVIQASRTVNMWPKRKENNSFLYHATVVLVTVISIGTIVCSSIQVITDHENLESVGFLVGPIIASVVATIRYIYVYVRGKKFQLIVYEIHNNFIHYTLFPVENRPSIMKHYKLANKLILIYCIFTLLWLLQLSGIPLFVFAWQNIKYHLGFNETYLEIIPYPVAMRVYAPFDYNKQPANALFYAYQFVVLLILVWIFLLFDCFWYMVIFLTIGQFSLLKDSVNIISEALKKRVITEENQVLDKDEIQQIKDALQHCITHHQFIRKFIQQMDDLCNSQILADTVYIVVGMCFGLLDTTAALDSKDWHRLLHSVEFIMSLTVHIFTYNWLATELALKEEELAEAVYDIPWYMCPTHGRLFVIMMNQAKTPIKLKGGKFFSLSREFFTTLMQAAGSYFMFFLQFTNRGSPS